VHMRPTPDGQSAKELLRPREKRTAGHKHGGDFSERGQILATRVGLVLPGDLPYEDWKQAGAKLYRIADSSVWCLGDWLAHGQQKYGDRYRTATKEAGLDYQTLRNYAWIARKFELSRRREELSFQHHAEVASLPAEEQDRWLDLAQQRGWSRNELRKNIRSHGKADQASSGATFIPRVPVAAEELARWQEAAAKSDSTFEEWMVAVLNNAATDSLKAEDDDMVLEGEVVAAS